ncbi:MAG: hypothetical protein XD60_1053 [Acetothermia bacterium 64_32]|nr:MAG: hypothetical protein XD60_1053 [Acetothermia bacterium 64_32]
MAAAQTAAGRELARRLCEVPEVSRVVVATRTPGAWGDLPVEVLADPPGSWHFGTRLVSILRALRPQRLLYFSSGSGFLLSKRQLSLLASCQPSPPPYAVLNNFYSTDFGLIEPPPLEVLGGLSRDNPLGLKLWEAGYLCYELQRSGATQLDIDTPGELQVLALHPHLPRELAEVLAQIPKERARAILELLARPGGELLVIGRVSGEALRMLDRQAACRVRALSEERGMEALNRAAQGQVRSLLFPLDPSQLVERLSTLADGVIWDTRVFLAAAGLWPLPEDRFSCDLLLPQRIKTPFLKELARACLAAPIPFLLGGHSLVSGGLYLACELAWEGKTEDSDRWQPLPIRLESRERSGGG